jgi:hypothetical protein
VRINNRLPRQWIIFGVLTLVVIVAAIIFFTNRAAFGDPIWSAPLLATTTPTTPFSVSGKATSWWTSIPTEPSWDMPTASPTSTPTP